MIAALTLSLNVEFAQIFNCADCNDEDKIERGCSKPITEGYVWEIPVCIRCRGTDQECELCRGSNKTKVSRCPCAIANAESSLLLPYFFDYYLSYKKERAIQWPDGRGRLHQPVQLKKAFNLLLDVALKQEEIIRKEPKSEGAEDGARS